MAIATQGYSFFPAFIRSDPTIDGSTTIFTINQADEGQAHMCEVPKDGTIDQIAFYIATHTTNGDLDVRVQTVSSGVPSGTDYGGSAAGTTTVTGTGWHTVSLGTSATATRGDKIGVTVTGSASTTVNTKLLLFNDSNQDYPYAARNAGAGWTLKSAINMAAIRFRYDDGVWAAPLGDMWGMGDRNVQTVDSSTSPKHVGVVFTPNFPMRVEGVCYWGIMGPASQGTVELINADLSSPLASTSNHHGTQDQPNSAAAAKRYRTFDTSVDLNKGTKYRVVLNPTAAFSQSLECWDINVNSALSSLPGGINWYLTEADASPTQESDWTDTNTTVPAMSLIVSGFESATSKRFYYLGSGGFVQ